MNGPMSRSLALALLLVLAAPIQAEEGQQQGSGSGWQLFKQDVKEAGRNIGKTGKEIGLGVAEGAKKGGKAVKEFFTGNGDGSTSSSD